MQQVGKTGIFLPLEAVADGGLVLERLPARQSLYPQIILVMLHEFFRVSLQLSVLSDVERFARELSDLLLCSLRERSELHRQLVDVVPR
jgi:hypothetical protein